MFFSVFNITDIENKVNVKYKTKNIITDSNAVFLAIINQIRANTNSSRNFRPMATRLCSVWLSGSFVCPRKKMTRVINVINEKLSERMVISVMRLLRFAIEARKYPAPGSSIFKSKSNKIYL